MVCGDDQDDTRDSMGRRVNPLPLLEPIAASNVKALCAGRQLHKLELDNCLLSGAGLCRLLGIGPAPAAPPLQHPLRSLRLHYIPILTTAALCTILYICGCLQHLELEAVNTATLELFQRDRPWPCASSLKELKIWLKSLVSSPKQGPTFQSFFVNWRFLQVGRI